MFTVGIVEAGTILLAVITLLVGLFKWIEARDDKQNERIELREEKRDRRFAEHIDSIGKKLDTLTDTISTIQRDYVTQGDCGRRRVECKCQNKGELERLEKGIESWHNILKGLKE